MSDTPKQNFLAKSHAILVKCSKHFPRSISIEEHLLSAALPNFRYLSGYLRDANILKQSTENHFLFRVEGASNFFDYFEVFTFVLFEQVIPADMAKDVASQLTLRLINIWDESDDYETYEKLMSEHFCILGIQIELQNADGEVGTQVGEILAILCQMAVNQIDPQKTTIEWDDLQFGVEIHQ